MPERQRTAQFADRFVLPDGTPVRMRAVAAGDRQLLQDIYAELSHRSRYRRFFSTPPRLTEPALDHLVNDVDQVDHVAVVLFAPAGEDGEEAVGVGRMIRYAADPTTADIALAVADEWQGRGVGSALARTLVAHRPAGVTRLVTIAATGNDASLAVLAGLGTVERTPAGSGVHDVTVTLVVEDGPGG
jgi:RimJ/RimL family protein N-acetyltransferase